MKKLKKLLLMKWGCNTKRKKKLVRYFSFYLALCRTWISNIKKTTEKNRCSKQRKEGKKGLEKK